MLLTKLHRNAYLRNSAIVFTGSLLISIVNYAYYPVLARLMTLNDFGEVQTLFSIFAQATLIFSAINIVTVVLVSSKRKSDRNNEFILELQKLMIYIVCIFGAIAILSAQYLKTFFNFDSVWPFIAMVFAMVAGIPIVFWNSYMQGKEDFSGMNILGIVGSTGRLVLAVIFVVLGFNAFGAIFGLFVGQLVAIYYISHVRKLPPLRTIFKVRLPRWKILKIELRYTALVFFVTLLITVFYTGDILIVKHFQNPEIAGAYAGIASIARIVFFVTLPFAVVLLPAINSDWEHRSLILKRSFLFVFVVGLATCITFWALDTFIIRILIGEKYIEFAYLLPKLSIAIFFISISNLLLYYLLSIRSLLSLVVSLVGVIVLSTLSVKYHSSLIEIVDNLLISSFVMLVALIFMMSIWPRIKSSKLPAIIVKTS